VRECEPITGSGGGAGAPSRGAGTEPLVGGQGGEADGILVLEHTFLRSPVDCSGSDLSEATRQRRTFDTAAILSVGLNDSLNGADVSHLEVLCVFLQVQSLE